MNSTTSPKRIAVIGGGISGLAAAHRLATANPQPTVRLFERGSRLGGVINTVRRDDFLFERSADSFLDDVSMPWARELAESVGLGDQLIGTDPRFRRALVLRAGRLYPVPDGFRLMAAPRVRQIMLTPILSPWGKARLAYERFVRPANAEIDESLSQFATRRCGREAYERLIQPLVSGIYTADPDRLSLKAALPQFAAMEQKHGSLTRAMRRAKHRSPAQGTSGARYAQFLTPRGGLMTLVDAVAQSLPNETIVTNATIQSIARDGEQWLVVDGDNKSHRFDAVISATPAASTAELVKSFDSHLANELQTIEHASVAIVSAAYRREQIGHPLDAFGLVIPAVENQQILSVSFSSVKFAGRAPDDHVLLRVFVGGAMQEQLVDLQDDEIQQLVTRELAQLLDCRGKPRFWDITRWTKVTPQYHVGHLDRLKKIDEQLARHPGLSLAGSAYRGIGIPQCIRSGRTAAEKIAAVLGLALAS